MRVTSTDISFHEGDSHTEFSIWTGEINGQMYFRMLDGIGEDEEFTQCNLSLDELEYLGKRILDAVEYQKNKTK